MGNLFEFPLITTLVVIRCSSELQQFASIDSDWTDLMPPEVKMRVKVFSKDNIRI